jgi:histidine ammonia-lyase
MDDPAHPTVRLDGHSLTVADLVRIAREPGTRVECATEALAAVRRSAREVASLVRQYTVEYRQWKQAAGELPHLDYGITTGFGEFKRIAIHPRQLKTLQHNILLSHCAGAGESADPDDSASYFPAEVVRATLAIRLNAFLKGHSGVTEGLVRAIVAMLNRGVVPLVPLRGSVGSSGDLAPLSHLFVVLLGEGRYWVIPDGALACPRQWTELRGNLARTATLTGVPAARRERAAIAARKQARAQLAGDLGLSLAAMPRIVEKEGLALTNGANFTAALLALAVHDGEALANAADVAAGMTMAAVCGCARALDERVHEARGHRGQIESAENLRDMLAASRQLESSGDVQDAYSLRCAPQVHGAARDTLAYAAMVVETEINSATDNPLFFGVGSSPRGSSEPAFDSGFWASWRAGYEGEQRHSFSAGNFHGEPVGFAADFLAIALAELADVSERRTQLLLDSDHNRHLPPNLVPMAGVNSGWMIAQYCAAGIVSENKVLAHPASVDSIPTSANSEDHNAMGIIAARKARTVLRNAQAVLAIELLVAAQALEWRVRGKLPATVGYKRREGDEARQQERSQFLAALARGPLTRDELGACGVALAYERVRALAEPLLADRPLDEDIRRVRGTLEDTSFVRGLNEELGKLGPATMRKRGARRAGRGGGAGRGEAPFPQVAPQRHLRPIRPLRSER